ncbi:MAG: hypothetical protein HFG26_07375 [Provencibacterium sp.]|jgi:stage III sporulation protein AG|nr:hypothetical protein [Provencibacterium sp.]
MEIKGGLVLLRKQLEGDKKVRLIVGIGLLGMALILASQFLSSPKKQEAVQPASFSDEAYIERLEKRLDALIETIDGVGKAQVMITLASSQQTVYATEEKHQADLLEDVSGEDRRRMQESMNRQSSYILVDQGSGRKEPLVEARLDPTVKGVVVVCPGADNKVVNARITEVVTTALGIGASKVCVVKGGT